MFVKMTWLSFSVIGLLVVLWIILSFLFAPLHAVTSIVLLIDIWGHSGIGAVMNGVFINILFKNIYVYLAAEGLSWGRQAFLVVYMGLVASQHVGS